MGCEYLSCEKCGDIHRDECSMQCALCSEYLTICEQCFDVNKNKFADYKASVLETIILNNKHSGLMICDSCIKYYDGIENIDNIDVIDDFDNYDIDKKSLDKR